jgi:2-polyprenyl-3-methyl-5-hydroxy-6-metoxy-1,4-benzoquinol methylase
MSKPVFYSSQFYECQQEGSFQSAQVVTSVILNLISLRSAVDVGCGVGTWLRALRGHGISDILGIDGDYVDTATLQIPKELFLPKDLSVPLELGRKFDLAISMEVAEHLPAECAQNFIRSLVSLAPPFALQLTLDAAWEPG